MLTIQPNYITDEKGKKISAVLRIKDFENLLERVMELEDIRLYDKAKKDKSKSISIEDAFKEIEAKRVKEADE